MRKRYLHVLNWDKYQARTDKEMPWCKLWGSLFDRPWFQRMPDSGKFLTFILLDLARKTGNKICEEYVSEDYLIGNYGFLNGKNSDLNGKNSDLRGKNSDLRGKNEVFKHLKSLVDNGFLSDNTSDIVDKIREEENRVYSPIVQNKPFDFKQVWDKYPSKTGVTKAREHFLKTVKTNEDFESINGCLDIYIRHLSVNTWKKAQNGSTWFNNWRDWVGFVEPNQATLTNAQNNLVTKLKKFGAKHENGNVNEVTSNPVISISKQDV